MFSNFYDIYSHISTLEDLFKAISPSTSKMVGGCADLMHLGL